MCELAYTYDHPILVIVMCAKNVISLIRLTMNFVIFILENKKKLGNMVIDIRLHLSHQNVSGCMKVTHLSIFLNVLIKGKYRFKKSCHKMLA